MAEDTGEKKVNLRMEQMKPLMGEGEVWVTNVTKNSERMVSRIDEYGKIKFEKEESGNQLAARLASYDTWESIRVVDTAFDSEGQPIKGMVALVGVPKAQTQ